MIFTSIAFQQSYSMLKKVITIPLFSKNHASAWRLSNMYTPLITQDAPDILENSGPKTCMHFNNSFPKKLL